MLPDRIPPEISFSLPSMIASNASWNVNPISAPPYTTALTIGHGEIFTEERIRQFIREELVAYFDEEKDILSAPAKTTTMCATCGQEKPVRFEVQYPLIHADWHRCCDECYEERRSDPSMKFVRPLSGGSHG